MMCEKCGKNHATTHIRTVTNGVLSEKNLCSYCAIAEGYTATPQTSLAGMLASMFGEVLSAKPADYKKCPICGKQTILEYQPFCSKKCATLNEKKRSKKVKPYLCQWCGQIFKSHRMRKFCNLSCQKTYMRRLGILKKTVIKVPVKITVEDVAKKSKEEKLTYGRYVSINKI